jgi:hypothetical protein
MTAGKVGSLLLFILTGLGTTAIAEDRWYVFSLGDTPVGYVSEKSGDGRTETALFARLNRLGKSFEMRFATTVQETPEGDLHSLSYESVLSKQATQLEALVEGNHVRITGGSQERSIERGKSRLLGPGAVERLTRETLRKEGDAVEYSIFSPELQRVVGVRRRVVARAEGPACAKDSAARVEETVEGLPVARTLWLDTGGTMIADALPGPFGVMTLCRATREAALAANGTLPADLYQRTLARSNIRIADPAAVDRIVLRLRPRDTSISLPELAAHNQRVVDREAGVTIEVRRPAPPAKDVVREPAAEEYLAANALVESTHPEIARIADEVAGPETDAYRAALALTRWVAENMSMDAGIVMAPASELIRDRKATCMGYATLLAALARATKIPSRIAMGYVYYGAIWGGHAWTEMWIDGRWLPFDAAVYAPGVASATRLAAASSSFREGGGAVTSALISLFGRVDVETLELEARGHTVRADKVAFRIDNGTYVNPGIGLRVKAKGYTIERADSTWPSPVVVAFRRGANTIELQQKSVYPARPVMPREGTAVYAVPQGATLWVWSAEGPNAAEALRRFLPRVRN